MSVMVLDRLDPGERREMVAPLGATIGEIVAAALPGAADFERARVLIGGHVIGRAIWHRVRPKPGAQVIIRVVPGNSGLLRSVLTIAVVIAAAAISGGLLAPALGTAFAGGSLGAGLAATGTLVVGSLLINALVPTRQDTTSSTADSPTYSISGLRNTLNPDGPVPRLLGRMRIAPIYAAVPYTETIGDDRYVVASFLFGYGPLVLSDFRIGTTPISQFSGVEIEVRGGYPGDAQLSLYPQQVLEESLSINLTYTAGEVVRTTAADCTEASIDLTFAQGLMAILSTGTKVPAGVDFEICDRPSGTSDWRLVATINVTANTQQPLVRSHRWGFPARGQYEVRLRRLTIDFDALTAIQASGRSDWTALRSFRPEYPIAFGKPLALVAVRIRATDQLNGMLDNFSALAEAILPDWDAGSGAWVERVTSNPASHFRHVLTGNAMAYPLSAEEMEALEDWHEWCAAKGLAYNRMHDYEAVVWDVLADIAAAGRATPQPRGTKWGVVIDRIQDIVRAHVTPRNSWGFRWSRAFVRPPDAFRVPFLDETNDYASAERVVPRPGLVGEPQVTEELQLPGITSPDLIWTEARRRFRELEHRPDTYEVYQDWEHLVATRGDLVRLSHDVLDRVQVSARVKSVSGSTVELDEWVSMDDGLAYACRFRLADGTSVLRTVITDPGETTVLRLSGAGALPERDDLAMFGLSAQESLPVIVKEVELGDDLTAKITYVDAAPEIELETDADTPPAWDGRVGAELDPSTVAPGVPVIASVLSGVLAGEDAVVVSVTPGPGLVIPATYDVDHRLEGAVSWATVTIPAGAGAASITGYADGDAIVLRARATSATGYASAYTSIVDHVVGATDPTLQDATALTATWTGTAWRYAWTLEALTSGMVEAAGVRIRYGAGSGLSWASLTALHTGLLSASPWEIGLPPELSTGDSYTFGAAAVAADGTVGTPLLTTVTA